MKKMILFSLVGALSLGANAQATQDTQAPQDIQAVPDTSSVRIPASDSTIRLPAQAHTMFKGDFDAFKGAYELANGKVLSLYSRGRTMFADVDGQGTTEIIAARSNVFVAVNEKMKITILHGSDGEVGGELLWVPPTSMTMQGDGSSAGRVESLTLR